MEWSRLRIIFITIIRNISLNTVSTRLAFYYALNKWAVHATPTDQHLNISRKIILIAAVRREVLIVLFCTDFRFDWLLRNKNIIKLKNWTWSASFLLLYTRKVCLCCCWFCWDYCISQAKWQSAKTCVWNFLKATFWKLNCIDLLKKGANCHIYKRESHEHY